ncbi:MAG TPA: phosphotransferase [Acidimicrobiales bacterium]
MDVDDARGALAGFADLAALPIAAIEGGWASWTFDVGGWIVRFPRNDDVADAARRELRLLPALAGRLPVATPVPTHEGMWRGRPFFAYRRIPGRPMGATDGTPAFLDALAGALRALHAFPVDEAAGLLGVDPTIAAWRRWYVDVWNAEFEPCALPALAPQLRAAVAEEFWRVVDGDLAFAPTLTHRDLGPEHVLVDDSTGLPVGVIDFEDASIGDPVMDFVAPVRLFGRAAWDALARGRDLGQAPEARLGFYTWCSALHHVVYGVREGVAAEVDSGIATLRARFAD